jgi:hypothetical protein
VYTLKQIKYRLISGLDKFLSAILKFIISLLSILSFSFAQTVNNCHTTPTGGLITGNVNYGTSINWANPNESLASDNSYARTSIKSPQVTKYLRDRNFQFAVPSYATITGIIVYIEKKQDAGANIQDNSVRIEINDVPVGNDKAKLGTTWPTTDQVFTYGGFGDMWGLSLSPSDINNSTFGVLTAACVPSGGDSSTTYYAYIDNVAIDVCFTVPYDSSCGIYSLPVSISEFAAHVTENNLVRLNWTTLSETDNNYFTVERSADGKHFEQVRKVNGAGNSNRIIRYETTDEANITTTGIYFYRLGSVDFNGNYKTETRSMAVRIDADDNALRIFPNPTNSDGFHFSVPAGEEEVQITLFNEHGEKLFEQKLNSRSKCILQSAVVFPQRFSAGIYRVQCVSNNTCYSRNLMLKDESH